MIRVPVLPQDECEDWVLTTLMLNAHWRKWRQEVPFYTLGLAAYLDCRDGLQSRYHDRTLQEANNRFLAQHFHPLFECVQQAMQQHFQEPVQLASLAAWPGFHIYQPHPVFASPVAKIHRDRQYRDVFPGEHFKAQDLYTFTLPLSNPEGSGMNWWREEPGNPAADPDCGSDGNPESSPEFIAYQVGELVLHDGLQLHQAVLQCDGMQERITLQGHAVRKQGRLWLYW